MSIKMSQPQQERLRRLLHMEYTVTELSRDLECPRNLIERAIAEGAPHRREHNRLYIVGDRFADWYRAQPQPKKKTLAANEAFCMRCHQPRPFTVDQVVPNSPGVERAVGKCTVCGAIVNRLRRIEVAE